MRRWWSFTWLLAGCGSDTVSIRIPTETFVGDLVASDVASLDLWVLEQLGHDNTPIACAALEQEQVFPNDPNVVILNGPIHVEGASPVVIKGIADGKQNRVFFVNLYSKPGQLGTRVGTGCVGGQTITGGKNVTIELEIVAAPPPSTSRD